MKVGIVTFYDAYNCGAFLQAFALQKKIRQLGAEPYFIDQGATVGRFGLGKFKGGGLVARLKHLARFMNEFVIARLRRERFDRCINQHLKVLSCQNGELPTVDCLIAGSDQIWNPGLGGSVLGAYLMEPFLSHGNLNSYAASFGISCLPDELKGRFAQALSHYKNISVREDAGASIVQRLLGREAKVVLDPTLLLTCEDYREVEVPRLVRVPYLCVYSVGEDNRLRSYAERIAKMKGLRLVYVQNGRMGIWGGKITDWRVTSPDRFLTLMRDCDCVLTNSFHGTIFSVLYRKPFVSIIKEGSRVSSRFETLLNALGLADHLMVGRATLCIHDIVNKFKWDVDSVSRRLTDLRASSVEFLRQVLGGVQ